MITECIGIAQCRGASYRGTKSGAVIRPTAELNSIKGQRRKCDVLNIVGLEVFYFAAAVNVPKCNTSQHCEVPECTNEIWSAYNASTNGITCLTLLCWEHSNSSLSFQRQYEISCKGRGRSATVTEIAPINLNFTSAALESTACSAVQR